MNSDTKDSESAANSEFIPIYAPSGLVRWLEDKGFSRDKLIENTGLATHDIDFPDALISPEQHRQLINNAINSTGDEHIGLKFGQQFTIASLGIVGIAAMCCETLGDALETLARYLKLRTVPMDYRLTTDSGASVFEFVETTELGVTRLFIYETMLSSMTNVLDMLGFPKISALTAHVTIPRPPDWELQADKPPYSVSFDADFNGFVFASDYLAQPCRFAEPVTARFALEICAESMRRIELSEGFVARVVRVILLKDERFPNLERAAEKMNVSSRTLRRELAKNDTTYQELLNKNRKSLALQFLREGNLSSKEIALELGYNDAANFGRAFKKWTGQSPGFYRGQ